jgi:hypothetical protein
MKRQLTLNSVLRFANSRALALAFFGSLLTQAMLPPASAQDLPAAIRCEYVPGPDRTIVCLQGTAVRPGLFLNTQVYDLCLAYFGDTTDVRNYCLTLAGGNVVLPGAPQFPAPVNGTTFTPAGPAQTFTLDEFCDWLFSQSGGISHYGNGLPAWIRNYCETRDEGQIPPGY